MNNGLQIFENTEFGSIRTLEIDGEPWFVGKEVAEILGYSNSSKAVMSHVDNEDKRIEMLPNSQNGNTVGKVTLINESGLYSLILRSKLEKAKRFKRWVTSKMQYLYMRWVRFNRHHRQTRQIEEYIYQQ